MNIDIPPFASITEFTAFTMDSISFPMTSMLWESWENVVAKAPLRRPIFSMNPTHPLGTTSFLLKTAIMDISLEASITGYPFSNLKIRFDKVVKVFSILSTDMTFTSRWP